MVSPIYLLALTSFALLGYGQCSEGPKGSGGYPHCTDVGSQSFHQHYVDKWLKFWDGDFSLLDQLVAPDMVMYADRVPSPSGNGSQFFPVTSSKVFGQVVQQTLSVYQTYHFDLRGWAGTDNLLAVRWTLEGTLKSGAGKPGAPTTNTVNGTDFIFLDKCTGRLKEYDLAADTVNRYHQLGYTSIPV